MSFEDRAQARIGKRHSKLNEGRKKPLGLVDFHFVLSILCVLLILLRLIRATTSVLFVPCCLVLLSFYLVLS